VVSYYKPSQLRLFGTFQSVYKRNASAIKDSRGIFLIAYDGLSMLSMPGAGLLVILWFVVGEDDKGIEGEGSADEFAA